MAQNLQNKFVRVTTDGLVHGMFPVIAGVLGLLAAFQIKVSLLDIPENRTLLAFGLGAGGFFIIQAAIWVLSKGPKVDISNLPPPPTDLEIVSVFRFLHLYLVHIFKLLLYFVGATVFAGALGAGAIFSVGILFLLNTAMLTRKAHNNHVVILKYLAREWQDEPKFYAMNINN